MTPTLGTHGVLAGSATPDARTGPGRPEPRAGPGRPEPRAGPEGGARDERGAVTAELAIVLPAVVVLLLACAVLGAAVLGQIRCADAARAGARAAAIGESEEQVVAVAQQLAGDEAAVTVSREGAWVVVEVSRPVAGDLLGLRGLSASATARAWVEPGGSGG